MVITVFVKACRRLRTTASWLAGGNVDTQLRGCRSKPLAGHRSILPRVAFDLGTLLTTVLAVVLAAFRFDPRSNLPDRVLAGAGAAHAGSGIRLSAGVPSVIYGLIEIPRSRPTSTDHP